MRNKLHNDSNIAFLLGLWVLIKLAVVWLLYPVLLVFVINGLAKSGGAGFHLEHSFVNYVMALVLLVLVRGNLLGE